MSITKDIKVAAEIMERIKAEICANINAMPDNPKIQRLCGSPNCFVIQFKDLGTNWSPEFHDYKVQYRWIADGIRKRSFDDALAMLNHIITHGWFREGINKRVFNPAVIEFLKSAMNT